MSTSIIVADRARARFFSVDPEARLEETTSLVHPEHGIRGHELHTSSRSGSRGGTPGRPHTLDDHRGAHRDESDRRFAGEAFREAQRLMKEQGVTRFVLVAEPRALGLLREELAELVGKVGFEEVPHELAGRTAHEIGAYLVERGVLKRRAHAPS